MCPAEPKIQELGRGERRPAIPGWFKLALIAQLVVGALMILIGIGTAPLWFDELASLAVAQRSLGGIFNLVATTDANMGFYYVLLHGWLSAGDSETWIRALSAIPALAAIPTTAILARRLFGDVVGLVAGFLLAGSMFAIENAQTARAYALALFLITLATLFFVEAVLGRRRAHFVACAVASTLAVYASPLSGLVLVALLASVPLLNEPRAVLRPVGLTFGAVAIAVTPLAVLMLMVGGAQVDQLSRPGLTDALIAAREMLAMNSVPLAAAWALLIGVAVAMLWRDQSRDGEARGDMWRWKRVLLVGWILVPGLLLFVYSQFDPLFRARYLLTSAPALAILAAIGLVAIARRSRTLGVAAGTVLVCLTLLARVDLESYGDYFRPGWGEGDRSAARIIAARSIKGDGILYRPSWQRLPIEQDLRREAMPGSILPEDFAVITGAEQAGDLYAREARPGVLKSRLRRHRRVWLLTWDPPLGNRYVGDGVGVLRSEYRPAFRRDFGWLELELYSRETQSNPRDRALQTFEPGSG